MQGFSGTVLHRPDIAGISSGRGDGFLQQERDVTYVAQVIDSHATAVHTELFVPFGPRLHPLLLPCHGIV